MRGIVLFMITESMRCMLFLWLVTFREEQECRSYHVKKSVDFAKIYSKGRKQTKVEVFSIRNIFADH